MAKNFTSNRPPDFHHGDETDMILQPLTQSHASTLKTVEVLPDETTGQLAKRLYGSNDQINRERILANNPVPRGKVRVPNVR